MITVLSVIIVSVDSNSFPCTEYETKKLEHPSSLRITLFQSISSTNRFHAFAKTDIKDTFTRLSFSKTNGLNAA